MKSYLNHIRKNILVKIGSFNAVAVVVRLIVGLLNAKIIAIFLGAEGMALMGNLRNFLSSVQSASTLGLYNGVVKYVAESRYKREELSKVLTTIFILTLSTTLILSGVLFFGASFWNNLIFDESQDYIVTFKILAILLPVYALNTLLIATINGYLKYKIYLVINIIASILGFLLTLCLVVNYNLDGAFLALILNPFASFLLTLYVVVKKRNLIQMIRINEFSFPLIKKLAGYSYMTLLSTILIPFVMIEIRNYIIDTDGINNAGYYEAMLRISGQYMAFLSTLLTLYLLPKLSVTTSAEGFRKEVFGFYKTIIPLYVLGFLFIYLLRYQIVSALFSKEFLQMIPLFKWFLVGDFLKILAMVLAVQFLAKRMVWFYTITELFSIFSLYLLTRYFVSEQGFVGASIAHFCNYALYLLLIIILLRKAVFGSSSDRV